MKAEIPDYFQTKTKKHPPRHGKIGRRKMILRIFAVITTPVLAGVYSRLEADWLELSKITLPFRGIQKKEKLKLLHLSDLHLSKTCSLEQIETALKKGFSESPDACFITGDFITDIPNETELEGLGKLLSIFASKIPTYACLGNHDGGSWSASHGGLKTSEKIKGILRKAGVRLLVNERLSVRIKGIPLQIVGVGDFWSKECEPRLCLVHRSQNPPRDPVILMCHNPDAKEILKSYFWNLMLAGHTHGGQFIVPFTKFAPFAPVVDQSIVEGLHSWDKWRYIHVTRGVGNLYGFRFNCRPEISLIELVSK